MKQLFKNKKGNVLLDGFTIFIALVVLIIISVVVNKVVKETNTSFQSDDNFAVVAKESMDYNATSYSKIWDGVFIFLLVGLWIASLALSYMIDTHPIFFIVSIILIIILFFIVAEVSNATTQILSDPTLQVSSNDYPMSTFIIDHLVETILVIAFTIAIALYAKAK